MESKSVTEMIAQWRDSVSDPESAPDPDGDPARTRPAAGRLVARIGGWRLVGAVAGLAVFTVLAIVVARPAAGPGAPPAIPQPGEEQAAAQPEPAPPPVAAGNGPGAVAATAATDWLAVMAGVDDARGRAYATGSPESLLTAFAADGPAYAAEAARVATIAEQGLSVSEWRTDILAVSFEDADPGPAGEAVLRVRDRRGEYRIGGPGQDPGAVPAAAESEWLVTLRWEGGRWLVQRTEPG